MFNKLQCDIIRAHSPGRDIIHNFMGRTLAFDHFDVGKDLDISSWDSYPLGFLEDRSDQSEKFKRDFSRSGDPDFQAFHHDLYRSTSGGRWWVMEQQPGPVNWAPHNPAPQDGMVRLWTLEAFVHGAETVSYFRWRQAPFAQEQMHSGLLRSNSKEAEGFEEAKAVANDLSKIEWPVKFETKIAIIFDYPSAWAWEIQPQGKEFDYFRIVYDFYKAIRALGLSVDFKPSNTSDLNNYDLVFIPALFTFGNTLIEALERFEGATVIGPRSGSKSEDFTVLNELPNAILDIEIGRVESLRSDSPVKTDKGNFQFWREYASLGANAEIMLQTEDGKPAIIRQKNHHYICGWPDGKLLENLVRELCLGLDIPILELPDGLRCVRNDNQVFVMNYGNKPLDLSSFFAGQLIYGESVISPSGFSIFQEVG